MKLLKYSLNLGPRTFPLVLLIGIVVGTSGAASAASLGSLLATLGAGKMPMPATVATFFTAFGLPLVLTPVSAVLITHLSGLYLRDFESRLGSEASTARTTETLESSDFHSRVASARAREFSLFDGLRYLWTGFLQTTFLVAGTAITLALVVGPLGSLIVLASVVFDAWWTNRASEHENRVWPRIGDDSSRAEYYSSVAIRPGDGKEVRLFSLLEPLRSRFLRSKSNVDSQLGRARMLGLRSSALGLLVRLTAAALSVGLIYAFNTSAQAFPKLLAALPILVVAMTLDLTGLRSMGNATEALKALELTSDARPRSLREEVSRWPAPMESYAPTRETALKRMGAPDIVFDGVSFTYPGANHAVLRDVSFHLPAGEPTALVGRNGAGKSTVMKLLAGAYTPTGGRVIVNGEDTTSWTEKEWRYWQHEIGFAGQDVPKLPLPLNDYLNLSTISGGQVARDSQLRDSLGALDLLHKLDRLPLGLATPVSSEVSNGTNFSGGEWQRLALAQVLRSIDAGSRFVLLDEPASALDVEAEARLVSSYGQLFASCTSLVVSHRFSVVRPIPNILVLDKQGIVETGNHDELMALSGLYWHMFNSQSSAWISDSESN